MMSGGIGAPLAAVCMTHRCVDTLCYSATPLPAMGQIARWTKLVSLEKAAGLGGGYSEIKTKLWRWSFKEASLPHWPADRARANNPLRYCCNVTETNTNHHMAGHACTIGILIPSCPDDDDDDDDDDDTLHASTDIKRNSC